MSIVEGVCATTVPSSLQWSEDTAGSYLLVILDSDYDPGSGLK